MSGEPEYSLSDVKPMLFYVFSVAFMKISFYFWHCKTTDCKSSSSFKSKTVYQPYRGDFKKLLRFSLFCFLVKEMIRVPRLSFFFLTT